MCRGAAPALVEGPREEKESGGFGISIHGSIDELGLAGWQAGPPSAVLQIGLKRHRMVADQTGAS